MPMQGDDTPTPPPPTPGFHTPGDDESPWAWGPAAFRPPGQAAPPRGIETVDSEEDGGEQALSGPWLAAAVAAVAVLGMGSALLLTRGSGPAEPQSEAAAGGGIPRGAARPGPGAGGAALPPPA